MKHLSKSYIGRFAPSPTGPLHLGSIVTALASYLQAKAHNGKWLVRMEDIDCQRIVPGAADHILMTLEKLHLHWDGKVESQSRRLDFYHHYLKDLHQQNRIYYCTCSRSDLNETGELIHPQCIERQTPPSGEFCIRFRFPSEKQSLLSDYQQKYSLKGPFPFQDFVVFRKEQIFSYQFVVVIDDWLQQITEVVRGEDLLSSTPLQIALFQCYNNDIPEYCHIPLVLDENGNKLSKSHLNLKKSSINASELLFQALEILNLSPPSYIVKELPEDILRWAQENWRSGIFT